VPGATTGFFRPWDRVLAICANVASLDRATSRCSRQNIAIKASFWKSLAEHPYVSRRDAPRLARVPKHHFRQSVFGNLFKGLGSQSTQSGLNCSYPITGPYGTANGTTTYTWDYHNRLLTIASSTTSTFNYDHTGDRARFYDGTSNRHIALMGRVSLFSLINFTKKISLKH
jgi:hypothetical protein